MAGNNMLSPRLIQEKVHKKTTNKIINTSLFSMNRQRWTTGSRGVEWHHSPSPLHTTMKSQPTTVFRLTRASRSFKGSRSRNGPSALSRWRRGRGRLSLRSAIVNLLRSNSLPIMASHRCTLPLPMVHRLPQATTAESWNHLPKRRTWD